MLEKINTPADVRALSEDSLPELCSDIRKYLVRSVSKTGGHLASNLGAVELTVALHRVFDTEKDRLVFDVGHQCYVHKILTGRKDKMDTLRQYDGLAGFPKPNESIHDAFIAGHASNSISVALGMARARRISGGDYDVIALIGDGALTGGLAYEALCDAGDSGEPLIIILNDNGMSINPNVGGMASYLSRKRLKPSYRSFKENYRKVMGRIPGGKGILKFTHKMKNVLKHSILNCSMFEEMGLQYAGPVDGHDVARVEEVLRWAKATGAPTLVHIMTQKGKGYKYAEENPGKFHGISPFDPETGETAPASVSFSSVFGDCMCALAEKDDKVCAITAAMTEGTGLSDFAAKYPERFFDVSIAEEHASAMAAGIAAGGGKPVFAVYSTFLQRAYDMLIHDVAIEGHHVVFGVDRAGLVGQDGETHHGLFDVGFLTTVPKMTVFAPASFAELRDMLGAAVNDHTGPAAVRYPRGGEGQYTDGGCEAVKLIKDGTDVTIITYGITVNDALEAARLLENRGVSAAVVKLGIIAPLSVDELVPYVSNTGKVIFVEEAMENGCVGQAVLSALMEKGVFVRAHLMNTGKDFVTHGSVALLRKLCGIDAESIADAAERMDKNG
ncbi:MAG: 1-deoxy-D-xylulose-5-phosphate synthase [Oscillospiraceae bacterium]|nr:1-deoxy-D-xylulose-5-phosphate synthase [Oscillospiraceae bacterium]